MTRADAVGRVARSAGVAARWVARAPVRARLALKDRQEAKERARAAVPTVDQRLDELVTFYTQYESLVETLCDAAQLGTDAEIERRYTNLRAWMGQSYPSLRRFVAAYLRYDSDDAELGLRLGAPAGDGFEALFAAPTLEALLRDDDGMMISRIMRTREALNRYGEHLRQLRTRD